MIEQFRMMAERGDREMSRSRASIDAHTKAIADALLRASSERDIEIRLTYPNEAQRIAAMSYLVRVADELGKMIELRHSREGLAIVYTLDFPTTGSGIVFRTARPSTL